MCSQFCNTSLVCSVQEKNIPVFEKPGVLPFGIIAMERRPASLSEAGAVLLSSDRGYRTRSERPMRSVVVREMPLSWQSREAVVPRTAMPPSVSPERILWYCAEAGALRASSALFSSLASASSSSKSCEALEWMSR